MVGPRRAILLATFTVLSTLTVGFAGGLAVGSRTLGSGGASVPRCDVDGVTVWPVLSGSNVASLAIGGIASECGSAELAATLSNGIATASGTAVVPVGGGSVSVVLATPPAFREAMTVNIAISGP